MVSDVRKIQFGPKLHHDRSESYGWRREERVTAASLSWTRIQLVECALQLFKLLSSLAELASRSRALVVGKVFGRFRDERIEVRCGLR
jgi:hypothetical protein